MEAQENDWLLQILFDRDINDSVNKTDNSIFPDQFQRIQKVILIGFSVPINISVCPKTWSQA